MLAKENQLFHCREQAVWNGKQQTLLNQALNSLSGEPWCGHKHLKTCLVLRITYTKEMTLGNDCAPRSKAVNEINNKSDSLLWKRVCAPVVRVCLLHAGHSHRLWQLPLGNFMMTALILSCKSAFVFDNHPNVASAQPGVIVTVPLQSTLTRTYDEILQCEGYFSLWRSIRLIVHLSILGCAALSCLSLLISSFGLANLPWPLFAVRWSDHGHLRVQTCYNHCLD